ncbi:MAG: DsbA family protein [Balneolaceae bacterium]
MSKTVQTGLLVAFVVVAVAALTYGLTGSGDSGESATQSNQPQKVTILKYSDYQCPACKTYAGPVEQLKNEFGELVEVEYKHFPLNSHQYAPIAGYAVEAARNQGKFKEMHDMIFANQEIWSKGGAREHFISYAEDLGLDVEQFKSDLESDVIHAKVEQNKQEGIRRQVNATPTFFINGVKIRQNPQSYEQFKAMVEMFMYRGNVPG